jgi:hypothetical protein
MKHQLKIITAISILMINGISYSKELPIIPTDQEAKTFEDVKYITTKITDRMLDDSTKPEEVPISINQDSKIIAESAIQMVEKKTSNIFPINLSYQVFDVVMKEGEKRDVYTIKDEIEKKLRDNKNAYEIFEQYGTIKNYKFTTNTTLSNSSILSINVENIPYVSETRKPENNSRQNDKKIYNSNSSDQMKNARNTERLEFNLYPIDRDSVRLKVRMEEIDLKSIKMFDSGDGTKISSPVYTENYALQDFKLTRGVNIIVNMSTVLSKKSTTKNEETMITRFNVVKFD